MKDEKDHNKTDVFSLNEKYPGTTVHDVSPGLGDASPGHAQRPLSDKRSCLGVGVR